MQPSNTPPDGDFVRYIERLTAARAAPGTQAPSVSRQTVPAALPTSAIGGLVMPKMLKTPFLEHIKWAAGLWITAKVLARWVPGAGFLFVPLLAFYAAWTIFKLRRTAPGIFPGH